MTCRVLVLATHLSRSNAGAAHATIDIANTLAESDWAEVAVHAYTRDEDALSPAIRFVRGSVSPDPRLLWRLPSLYRLRHAVAELPAAQLPPADVCYTQSTELGLAYRLLHPATPIISHTGHVLVDRELREELSTRRGPLLRLESWMQKRTEMRTYREPHWTHVVSTRLVARQRERHYGLPEGFFEVRPLGVDGRRFDRSADHPDVRAALGIPADAVLVATVARLVPWKGIDTLLRALASSGARPWLVVVGQGGDESRLRALAAELGLAERVRFVGHAHPAPYLAAADLFALPSLIESFGMVYAEAMHLGLPCIGLRYDPPRVLSSAMDVIPDGVAGYCVSGEDELRDRIERLAGDPALRRRLGEQAHALATREYSARRYVEFVRELVERGRTPGTAVATSVSRQPATQLS